MSRRKTERLLNLVVCLLATRRYLTAEQIRRSILEPNADTAQGYAAVAGTMPQTFGQQLTAAQLESLVRYLSGLK